MQGFVEALGIHIGAEILPYNNGPSDKREYVKQILKDLDTPASLENAIKYRDSNSLRKYIDGVPRPFNVCCSSTTNFAKYSLGFQLHFLFVKQLLVVFFIIATVSILPLYLNYTGDYYTGAEVQTQLDYFSIGNQIGVRETSTEKLDIDQIEKNYEMIWVADSCNSGFFFLMVFIFFIYGFVSIKKALRSVHRVSDYAIEVKGLPRKGVEEIEIREYFSKFGEVAEIFIGRRYHGLLYQYTERANILQEINMRASMLKFQLKDLETDKKLKKLKKKLLKYDEKILKSKITRTHEELEIKRAYVVFDRKEDKVQCIKSFKKVRCCGCNFQKKRDRFRNEIKLRVFQASEPSDIIWENLEVGSCSRFFRFIFSLFLTLIVLIISISMIYYVKTAQSMIPDNATCAYYDTSQEGTSESSVQTLCYCKNLSTTDVLDKSTGTCSVYLQYLTYINSMKFLSSFGIILMNFFLKVIMRKISIFERPKSKSEVQNKIFKKVLLLMFINTAILIYLVNLSIPLLSKYILGGSYNDFTRDWYLHVGTLILTLMIISLGSPHLIFLFIAYPIGACKRKCCYKSKKSQYELNSLFSGPDFDIATRTSQIVNVVFTSYLYSGGLPLLNCTCFIYLLVIYYTDKCLVLRHFRSPPSYNQDLYLTALKIIPFGIMMHCGVALYMYGNNEIFPVSYSKNDIIHSIFGENIAGRIERPSGIVNCILIASGILLILLLNFLDLVCNRCIKRIITYDSTDVCFTDIKEQISRVGLTDYNIRKNPDYALIINAMDENLTFRGDEEENKGYFDTSKAKTATLKEEVGGSEEDYLDNEDLDQGSSVPSFSRDSQKKIEVRTSAKIENLDESHEGTSLMEDEFSSSGSEYGRDCISDEHSEESSEEVVQKNKIQLKKIKKTEEKSYGSSEVSRKKHQKHVRKHKKARESSGERENSSEELEEKHQIHLRKIKKEKESSRESEESEEEIKPKHQKHLKSPKIAKESSEEREESSEKIENKHRKHVQKSKEKKDSSEKSEENKESEEVIEVKHQKHLKKRKPHRSVSSSSD